MSRFLLVQAVTAARLPLAIAFAVMLPTSLESPRRLFGCLVLLLLQEVSDVLDGFLARRLKVVSPWGQMFDPFADSASRLIVFWSLASAGLALAVLPLIMALRDIVVAYSRLTMLSHGGSVAARASGKIKAWAQGLGAIFLLLASLHSPWTGAHSPVVVSWIVLLVTAFSAVEYVAGAVALTRAAPST